MVSRHGQKALFKSDNPEGSDQRRGAGSRQVEGRQINNVRWYFRHWYIGGQQPRATASATANP
jgi:hypothetical protein